jgi:hypothetical protein
MIGQLADQINASAAICSEICEICSLFPSTLQHSFFPPVRFHAVSWLLNFMRNCTKLPVIALILRSADEFDRLTDWPQILAFVDISICTQVCQHGRRMQSDL